jgi:putative ABC transport system substrate-binding protein
VRIDLRRHGDDTDRIRALAQELVGLQPDIILAGGNPAAAAVQMETRTIPIVFATVGDPVVQRIVARLNQPGGNITGFALYEPTLGGKWLELLSEIAPGLKRAAIMFNPEMSSLSTYMPSLETGARSLKVVPIIAPVHSDAEIEAAVMALGREPGGGLVVMPARTAFNFQARLMASPMPVFMPCPPAGLWMCPESPSKKAHRHIAFGTGIHFCLGHQ